LVEALGPPLDMPPMVEAVAQVAAVVAEPIGTEMDEISSQVPDDDMASGLEPLATSRVAMVDTAEAEAEVAAARAAMDAAMEAPAEVATTVAP